MFDFRYADTASCFGDFLAPYTDPAVPESPEAVTVSDTAFDEWHKDWNTPYNAFTEFGLSVYPATDHLLHHGACAFHGAAFLWRGKAWLLSADSGVGKSTQLKNLTVLYGNEIRIMNGDKPIIRKEETDTVTVWPSPWKGKECWGEDHLTAPLGGLILLKQGAKNEIRQLQATDCAARILSLCFSMFEKEETVRAACRIAETILETVPVWQLTNRGDLDSSRLVHDTLLTHEGERR